MKLLLHITVVLFLGFTVSCKVSESQNQQATVLPDTVGVVIDSLDVDDTDEFELRLYRGEQTRHFKLIHTRLGVSFDWEKQHLHGKANLILEPYFYDQTHLVLDAKDFDIHRVEIHKSRDTLLSTYKYNGQKLDIELDKTYSKDEKLYLEIQYTAKPEEGQDSIFTANTKKGLYFINPLGNIPGKPQQIWTHGETNTSSKWFPTIDAPNQKSTQEIYITVDEQFKTLSNGKLIYSKSNNNGTRTDYWKMDKPHAPYLFMMAVGDFAVVEDRWNDIPVNYYVEPEFEPYAEDVFGHTPEMIDLFSKLLNYPYPWDKYSQVVVRDFVSGAMENTTASVFMEDLNVNQRELIDYDWDDIIAHELFHQWFGDLVTCESWANLPLNESFATYGEYMWKSHKYGRDEGDYHLYNELQSYLQEAETKQLDLIRFDYLDEDEMFDNHSYAKGGLILHMLRNYVGDEAFFKSLENYLRSYAYGKAEIHELRLAFEQVTGEDLNWFFNQWFLDAGHPVLKVEQSYDSLSSNLTLKIWQEQNQDLYPIYKLPLTLDLWIGNENDQYLVEIDRPYQEFEFEDISEPDLLLLDSENILVGEIHHEKSKDQWINQYRRYDQNVRARYNAFEQFKNEYTGDYTVELMREILKDPFWVIREEALLIIEKDTTGLFAELEEIILQMAMDDPKTLVQAGAISALSTKSTGKYQSLFREHLFDSSYAVSGNALYAYLKTEATDIPQILDSLSSESNFSITSSIADYYIMQQDFSQYSWFDEKLDLYSGSDLWYFIRLFGMYLITAPPEMASKGIEKLSNIARNHHQFYNRLSAFQSLQLLSEYEGVKTILEELKNTETDPRIKDYYE